MDEVTIDTSELDGLAELLGRFPLEVQDKMLKQSLGAGAAVLMLKVMEKCPVRLDEPTAKSTGAKPGWLKANIGAEASKSGRAWYIGAGTMMAYLMRWLERGHLLVAGGRIAWTDGKRSHRGTGGKVIGHVPPHPVLRPAFDEGWRMAVKATAVELQTRIADYWRQTQGRMKKVA